MQELQKVHTIHRASPTNTEFLYSRGLSHHREGHLKEAIQIFSILCTYRPVEIRFWLSLSTSLQEAKRYEEAHRTWGVAAILQDSDPYPHFHIAECCLYLHNFTEASQALEKSLARIEGTHPLLEKIAMLKKQWNEKQCL